jgi:hypothetical protein
MSERRGGFAAWRIRVGTTRRGGFAAWRIRVGTTRRGGFAAALALALATVGVVPAAADNPEPPRAAIIGGAVAPAGRYPFVALIDIRRTDGSLIRCSGALVAPTWVATAAHCVQGDNGVRAVANGTNNGTQVTLGAVAFGGGTSFLVTRALSHPGYKPELESSEGFDVGLLQLASSAEGVATPVPIATPSNRAVGNGVLVGWGDTNPSADGSQPSQNVPLQLREAPVGVLDRTPRTILVGSSTTGGCFGDSGGPYLVPQSGGWRLAGIVSGGDNCDPRLSRGTLTPDVADNADWLSLVIGPELGVDFGAGAGAAGRFTPVTPTRLVDTRNSGRLQPGGRLDIALTGAPTSATAVAVNVTAVNGAAVGTLRAFACDRAMPPTLSLVFSTGSVTPNLVVAPTSGAGGHLCLATDSPVDVVVDLQGWFASSSGAGFTPLNPTRVLDTRSGPDPRGAPMALEAGQTVTLKLAGANGVRSDARSVLVNLTAVAPTANGYLTAYPCDQPRPLASNLNPARGQIVANQTLAPLAADGTLCIYSFSRTDVVVDLAGYYASDGVAFTPIGGVRVADTGAQGESGYLVGPSQPLRIDLSSRAGVPSDVRAVSLNLATIAFANGYLTAYPCDRPRPLASNLNYVPLLVGTNLATVPVAADGSVCIFSYKPALIVADLVGWYR